MEMQSNKNNFKFLITICLLFLTGFVLLLNSWINQNQAISELKKSANQIPETVFVKKYYPKVKIEYVSKPYKVIVYKQDTALRKAVEDSNIILGVQLKKGNWFKPSKLIVDKITPQGFVFSDNYNANNLNEFKLNSTGEIEINTKKRRLFFKIGLPLIGTAALFTTGYILLKNPTNKINTWPKL